MGKIGLGYGSEWHLLRFLGRHRAYLDEQTINTIGDEELFWLDFNFSNENKSCLRGSEWNGLNFITDPDVLRSWYAFWPKSGRSQNRVFLIERLRKSLEAIEQDFMNILRVIYTTCKWIFKKK